MYGNARYYYHNMTDSNGVFSNAYAGVVGDLGRSVSADVSIIMKYFDFTNFFFKFSKEYFDLTYFFSP